VLVRTTANTGVDNLHLTLKFSWMRGVSAIALNCDKDAGDNTVVREMNIDCLAQIVLQIR